MFKEFYAHHISGHKTDRRYHAHHICSRRKEAAYGLALTICLLVLTIGSMLVFSFDSGPMILGTEMNANGTVEYLCLGSGCENVTPMDW